MDLTQKKCVPCEKGAPPLLKKDIDKLLPQVSGWTLAGDMKSISREYSFKDFKWAMSFVNEVADLAEFEGHHPDIYIWWNKVKLTLTTHAINGLSENDFIVAAKINGIETGK